ncbi:MAG: TIGR04282 family arsenosugar biosynthesis glycosyltransferase [Gammaproteobacteria bacterium]|nr:TIGR04282 family arsenosugar biosynthesis glycosyltransferase [Gammaproteobacteria bacterium]
MPGNNEINSLEKSRVLILFAKAPEAGKVKTRLVPALGEEGALGLYQKLLEYQLAVVQDYTGAVTELHVDGNPAHPGFDNFSGSILKQTGNNLGERMHYALNSALATHTSAVLIGSDCPGIDYHYLDSAFTALENGFNAVLGPAEDGGYVLIGLRSDVSEKSTDLFQDISWGTDTVSAQTRNLFQKLGLTWKELPVLQDLDEPSDLEKLGREFKFLQG